jgi:hypothetical protein
VTLASIGVLIGSVAAGKVPALRGVAGVAAVELENGSRSDAPGAGGGCAPGRS